MLFAGFNVHEGEYPLWAAVAVGSAANLVGSWIAYAIGYYGRLELLEKHGKFLHITPSHLAWADRWFERYGAPAVFFSRMLPIIRTFISLPAGVARMPFWRFSVLTIARLPAVGLRARPSPARRRPRTGRPGRTPCTTSTTRSPCSSSSASSTSPSAGGATATAGAPRMRRPDAALELRHAVALGVLHGPTELLPISSSAHTTLVPWLLGWPYADLDPELRKAFEVALHAGTAAALLVGLRAEVAAAARGLDHRRAALILGSFVPPAIVGYTLERPIERRLGTPPTIAVGLLRRRRGHGGRRPARADGPTARGGRLRRRARARLRPGLRAHPRGLAQRHDAGGGARARLRPRRRQRALAPRGAAGHRRGDRAQGRAPGAARRPARRWRAPSRPAWAPPSSPRWPRCGSSARSSATAPSRPTPPTARRSRAWCSGALGRIARDERVLRRRRRRHRPGRRRGRRARRRPAHDRARPAQRLGRCPAATTRRVLRVAPNLGIAIVDRRRRLEDRRRRAGRSPGDGRHRLHRDERQRPRLRRRRADRDARLPGRRAGRPGGAGAHRAAG